MKLVSAMLILLLIATEAEARRHYGHHRRIVHHSRSSNAAMLPSSLSAWPPRSRTFIPFQYATGTSVLNAYTGGFPVTFGVCSINTM